MEKNTTERSTKEMIKNFWKLVESKKNGKRNFIAIVVTVVLLIYYILFSYPLFYFSFYSGITSCLNLISYFVFGIVLNQIRKHILEPQKSIEKIKKFGRKIIISGLFITVANLLFLIDGLNQSFPEARLFYYIYYITLTIPLFLNTIAFTIYGFLLIIKRTHERGSNTSRKSEYIVIKFREKVRKIRRTTVSKMLKTESLLIIILSLSMLGNTTTLKNIDYNINYEVDADNPDTLVDVVETLDYLSSIKYHDAMGEIHNLTNNDFDGHLITHYINREYIESLKEELCSDSKRFHWWSGHYHYFNYLLKATEEPKLYFTYNNNTMIRAQYENYEEIFVVERNYNTKKRVGNWYINFTQVPYVVNQTSISLNNTFLVKMILKYDYLFGNVGGIFYEVEQFLVLDAKFHVIFIYIPLVQVMVA